SWALDPDELPRLLGEVKCLRLARHRVIPQHRFVQALADPFVACSGNEGARLQSVRFVVLGDVARGGVEASENAVLVEYPRGAVPGCNRSVAEIGRDGDLRDDAAAQLIYALDRADLADPEVLWRRLHEPDGAVSDCESGGAVGDLQRAEEPSGLQR